MVLDSLLEVSKLHPTKEAAKLVADDIIALGKKNKDQELQLEGEYYLAFYTLSAERYDENAAVDVLEKIANKAQKNKIKQIQIRINHILGYYFFKVRKNYERGFRYYLKSLEMLDEISSYHFPNKAKYSHNIANAFYNFRDITTAIKILRDVEPDEVDRYNWYSFWSARNNLGLYYEKINKIDSAMYFYNQALDNPYLEKDDIRYTITKGNIGSILVKSGRYAEALPLLTEDMENAVRHKDFGVAANAATNLSEIYIKQSDFPRAKQHLNMARIYVTRSQQNQRLFELYRVFSDYYTMIGKFEMVAKYKDSLLQAHQNNEMEYDAMVLLRAQQKENLHKLEQEKQDREKLRRNTNLRFIVVSIIGILLSILVYTIVQRQYKKRERKKEEEIKLAKEKLSMAENELKSFAQRIAENQKILDSISQIKEVEVNAESLELLRQRTILTEDDWRTFSKHFSTIYPRFMLKVKNRIPAVTPAELRLLMLTKLNMDSKQIASAQGISSSAVRTTWYRLRKKINVEEELSAAQLVKDIESS